MFSEIMHGLVSRMQQDAGVDENSTEETLIPCGLRIGVIPAGQSTAVFPDPGTGARTPHILYMSLSYLTPNSVQEQSINKLMR